MLAGLAGKNFQRNWSNSLVSINEVPANIRLLELSDVSDVHGSMCVGLYSRHFERC